MANEDFVGPPLLFHSIIIKSPLWKLMSQPLIKDFLLPVFSPKKIYLKFL